MRGFTATVAVLVVAASLVAAIPAGAVGDRAPADSTGADSGELDARELGAIDDQEPPDLPEQWRQTYGASGEDIFSDLVRTDDGGYLLVGWTERETTDGWVMKVDGEGEQEWERTLGGSGTDRFWGVARTDEGFLLAGRTDADGGPSGWIVEVDSDGEVREERTAGSGAFNSIARDESGENSGYLLAGWSNGNGQALKLDGNLSQEWQESYPTPEGYQSGQLRAVVPVESGAEGDGGYYLAGKIEGESDDGWVLKVDSEGTPEWQKTAGTPNRDEVWAAAPASSDSENGSDSANGTDSANDTNSADGGVVIAGEIGVDTDDRNGWLVKFDANGSVAWERTPGSEGAMWFDSAMQTEDGFLFTGSANDGPTGTTEGYVLHTDADGTAQWDAYYGTQGWDKPWPAIRAHGGGYLLAGQTAGDGASGNDGWLVRIGDGSATGTNGEMSDGTDAVDTTDSAIRPGTGTTANPSGSEGGVPGMGVVTALLALAALLFVARR